MNSSPGRRRFFWTLVVLFILTTATVLFFTFGYRFDVERGLFIHTGSFTLKVSPIENAVIEVDGKNAPAKTLNILNDAFHIDGLMPGEHFIRVSVPGYSSWEKKAIIESGRSTEFWNITLIGNAYEATPVPETESVKKLFPSPENNLFALIGSRDGGSVIETLDTDSDVISEIAFIPETSLNSSTEENLEWSTDTKNIIVPLSTLTGQSTSFLIDTETGSTINLSERSGISDIRYPRWDGRRENVFYFLSGSTLYEWSTDTIESSPTALAESIGGYDISQNFLYYIDQKTGIVFRLKSGSAMEESEQVTPREIPDGEAFYALTVYDEDRIAIRNRDSGSLFIFNNGEEEYFRKIGDGMRNVQFSNDGKKLLFTDEHEISVYFVRPWNTQPLRAENEVLQIARFAGDVRFAQWTKDYEHVAFVHNNSLKTIELDHRDRRDIQTIRTFEYPVLQFLGIFSSDQIFMIEERPGPTLSFIPFPIIPLAPSANP